MGTDSPALAGTLVDLRPRTLLHFLGLTGKTGVLRVQQRDRSAAVWLRCGQVIGLGTGALDSVVAMLRMPTGEFGFEEVAFLGDDGDGVAVGVVLAEAARVLADWEEAAQAVPSTSLVIELRQSSDDDTPLSSDAWAVSVAVAGGHVTPASAAEHLRWGLLRTCRAVKELADSGRAELLPPVRRAGPMLSGPADVVMASATPAPALWPGGGAEASVGWRTPWYDPGE